MDTSLLSAAPVQTESGAPMVPQAGADYFEPQWYAAYTCANHEKRVAQEAERRSVECFLPLYESVRRWKDRRVRLKLPLFPGYVFVRLALRDRLRVLEIPGVARLVGFNGHPTPVPAEDIERLRACVAGGRAMRPHAYVRRGQRVRVLSGPLAGFSGIVLRQRNGTRFVVSFDLLERSVEVELEGSDMTSVNERR
jgi:transcription antitermination factor NusG